MFSNLPQTIQQQVLCYLEVDNFTAAKALYDQHFQNSHANNTQDSDIHSDAV